ncbi:PEP-CTERM sorting domain-containing protein [Rubellicoccus peritrichatus]|uniref:PEP-CTERM sorting domain-containing protein n=1 Tax=Rubellicoccus peritrichatus TaxID=3080537 RepID=A0AAQ3LCD3_9BACT|nr:PEP-CTERM sorting domain-containing protein [Puniceicoccus sp. CR14]WOO41842.1 PEP-CTERM sorting domain-containing protein [Puniceicoccus sp. CR14]
MKLVKYVSLAALCSAGTLFAAPFTDPLDNTDNLNPFGGLVLNDNGGSGIVSMTRAGAGDEGADWNIGGTTNLSLDLADQQFVLNITPEAQIGDGQWHVNILFFDGGGSFISENNLIGFNSSTSLASNNIADFATNQGVVGADNYLVRMRIQGTAVTGGFSFSEFAAVPEPGHFALLIGGLSLGLLVYRKKYSK